MKDHSYRTCDPVYLFKVIIEDTSTYMINFEQVFAHNPAGIYLLKVNSENTKMLY